MPSLSSDKLFDVYLTAITIDVADLIKQCTVTHMTIVRKRLSKHILEVTLSTTEGHPLPGNRSLNTSPQQQISTQ
jgi:hypothetical protein